MKNQTTRNRVLLFLAAVGLIISSAVYAEANFPDPPADPAVKASGNREAVLAGGCFWGMEGVFERLKGVLDVTSGYSGGTETTAHYEIIGTGKTGHAESIRIVYDPSKISFGTLLKVFFSVAHDPTQLNYQGPDVGTQYRSAIFYANEEQRRLAEEYIRVLDRAKVFPKPVVTQVVPLKAYYPAEEYHQDFMDRNPNYPYIVYWDLPKIAHLEKVFPDLLARR
ncbi:MAG TPA: peptide-methionine (S)-S-oxide reductase MsrA [Spirochaetia bacterium]|nr:peptide-methionine (S)-S-oxide reductase MsrA [Spirochaetia bacterium]